MSPIEAKEYGIIDHIIGGEEVSRGCHNTWAARAGSKAKAVMSAR
jgi:hypothetical protein